MRAVLATAVVAALASPDARGEASGCAARLGEPLDFMRCPTIELPGVEIELTNAGRRDPNLPMWCVDYEVRSTTSGARVDVPLCSTGVLGGTADLTLDGVDYVVDRDVPVRCVEGRWRLGLAIRRKDAARPPLADRAPPLASLLCRQGDESEPR